MPLTPRTPGRRSAPRPRPLRDSRGARPPARPQVRNQETWGFPAYGVGVGLWIMISSLPRRRLVLNHILGTYHFSIQGRTVCQGPMHLVYVRLALSSDGDEGTGWARVARGPGRGRGCCWGAGGAGQLALCPVPWSPASGAPPPGPRAEPRAPLQPAEGASSNWFCAATSWSR